MTAYHSRAAQQAEASGYGDKRYWDYLEATAQRLHDYYAQKGDADTAVLMLTQTLGEALQGNDGD